MVNEPGRGRDDGLSAEPPAFSDEGMRRIIYGRDRDAGEEMPRDSRSRAFDEDTEELAADLRGRRNLVPVVTAIAALVCFAAIVWYAYTWGTGQMSTEELPVVRAEPMPEKVRPEQPGGMEVPHQGIAVLNDGREGEAPQTVERLLPRPEIPAPPEPLPEEPGQAGAADAAPDSEAPLVADSGEADATEMPEFVDPPEFAEPDEADEGGQGIAMPQPKPDRGDEIAQLLRKETLETANGEAAKVAEPAPAPVQTAPVQTAPVQTAPVQTAPVQTAKVTSGDVVLQLSSVKSEAAATQEWKRLQAAHPALLGKLSLSLDTAAVQGATYYRVQTGPFASRAAAADVCTQLKARNQDCLVKQR